MKKIIIAAMSLSLLTGSVVFAQNTSTDTMKKMHKKKGKKSTATTATGATK